MNKTRYTESGNVLFLILIAVALFAALSYAVTQSSRSGAGNSNQERSLISSSQVTQYPASVRTSLVRMIIDGTEAADLYFNQPSDFDCPATSTNICATDADERDETRAVFHPSGGGGAYQLPQPEIMDDGAQGQWVFSADWEIDDIGTSLADDAAGNDIIAFLPGIKNNVCKRINEEFGITGGTDADSDGVFAGPTTLPTFATHNMDKDNAGIPGTTEVGVISHTAFVAQPFGCYDTTDGDSTAGNGPYVYYHVLIER